MQFKKNTSYQTITTYFGKIDDIHGCTIAPKGEVITLTVNMENGDVFGVIVAESNASRMWYRIIKIPLIMSDKHISLHNITPIKLDYNCELMYNGSLYFLFVGPMMKASKTALKTSTHISSMTPNIDATEKIKLTHIKRNTTIIDIVFIGLAIGLTFIGLWYISVSIIMLMMLSQFLINKYFIDGDKTDDK